MCHLENGRTLAWLAGNTHQGAVVVVVVVATPPHGGASDLIVSLSQTEFVTQTKTMTQQTDATEEVKIIQHH